MSSDIDLALACKQGNLEHFDELYTRHLKGIYAFVYYRVMERGTAEDLTQNVGDRVFFELDSSTLSGEAQQTLDRQATWLKQYNSVNVTVEGHCDERGTREYNLALGERRAANTKKYLVGAGIPASRISTISYGKERPAVIGSDDSSWDQNRRAVTVLTNQ